MRKYRVERLEQLLQYIEELAYLEVVTKRITNAVSGQMESNEHHPIEGVLKNYHDFRDALLHAAHTPFDTSRFGYPQEHMNTYIECMLRIMGQLFAWSRYSRRVFHISDDLRVLLEATRFPDIDLREVPWPFDAFVVTFESPLPSMRDDNDKEESYTDLVLFTRGCSFNQDGVPEQLFSFIPTSLGSHILVDEKTKNTINTKIQKGLYVDAFADVANIRDRDTITIASVSHPMNLEVSLLFGKDLAPEEEQSESNIENTNRTNHLVKLIGCFALYLTTLPPQSSAVRTISVAAPPSPQQRVTIPGAIRTGTEVCDVTFNGIIDIQELGRIRDVVESGVLTQTGGIMPPHFRQGYFSRSAGRGSDPSAPKTIWHRPTFVNRHLLMPGTLPGGKRAVIEP